MAEGPAANTRSDPVKFTKNEANDDAALVQGFLASKSHTNSSVKVLELQPPPAAGQDVTKPESPHIREAHLLIQEACYRDRHARQFALIVIGAKLPNTLAQKKHNSVPWAEIDSDTVEEKLDDTFSYMGSARLILRNPTRKLLEAVMSELPKCLATDRYHRVTTYFKGHGADGRFYVKDDYVHIVNEVLASFNSLPMQRFHYFDCCRVGEDLSFSRDCLRGNAAVIYATQPGYQALTGLGEGGRGTSDGVGVFTREFVDLVKTHDGSFEEFVCKLGCKTIEELKKLDSKVDTERCRATWFSTNVIESNFKEDREKYVIPNLLHVNFTHNGYIVEFTVDQPPSLVEHDEYVVKTHELQIKKVSSDDDWVTFRDGLVVTPGERHVHKARIPQNMLGYKVVYRVQARTGDGRTISSDPVEKEPLEYVKPVVELTKKKRCLKCIPCHKGKHAITWRHNQPPHASRAPSGNAIEDLTPPHFVRYKVEIQSSDDDEWERPNGLVMRNYNASFRISRPGKYNVCVSAHFEEVEAVLSEAIEITVSESYCTCYNVSAVVFPTFIAFIIVVLILAIVLHPRKSTQYQLYQNDIIECSTSSSVLTRILYSHWNFQECPNLVASETPYNDINATVIPLNGGKKNEQCEEVHREGTYISGRYSLPYPSFLPASVQNRYMIKDSGVMFDVCVIPQYTSSSPFFIAMYNNYTYFANFVRQGDELHVQKIFSLSLSKHGQRVCKSFNYTVEEASYLYFAFSTPVEITLSVTTRLKERYYESWSGKRKYEIGTSTASIPISLWNGETVLCHSTKDKLDRDRTHVCATPVLRIHAPISIGVIGFIFCCITIAVCCGKNKRRILCARLRRDNLEYARV